MVDVWAKGWSQLWPERCSLLDLGDWSPLGGVGLGMLVPVVVPRLAPVVPGRLVQVGLGRLVPVVAGTLVLVGLGRMVPVVVGMLVPVVLGRLVLGLGDQSWFPWEAGTCP